MGDWIQKRGEDGLRDRPRPIADTAEPAAADRGAGASPAGPAAIVRSLQRGAGNAAVAALIGAPAGSSGAGVQRAPLRPEDELMPPGEPTTPDAATTPGPATTGPVPTGPVTAPGQAAGPATASPAGPAPGGAPGAKARDGFEAALFDQTILDPMRSLYAVVRDDPPDAELAIAKLQAIGQALMDYQIRFEASDPELGWAFEAVRGWLSRPYEDLKRRVGSVKPMSDREIAQKVEDVIDDLGTIRARLP